MSIRERLAFLSQWRADFEHTGAVQPSSRHLAHAMTEPLRRRRPDRGGRPVRILEIGPGTGAVTRAIATLMGAGDRLECYEINPRFASFLRRQVQEDPLLSPVADHIAIHNAPAQELADGQPFDFAICSAPLNNFDAATIDAILGTTLGALANGGTLTFFEYLLLPEVRRLATRGAGRRRLAAAQEAKQRWLSRHGRGSTVVLRNLPPARVRELVARGSATPPRQAASRTDPA
ncbi:MAG TPA: methyltransferase [Acidobacteriota bacterium]